MLTRSSVDGHWGCFHSSATASRAATNIRGQVLVWMCVFVSLGQTVGEASLGPVETVFNHLRNRQTVFQDSDPPPTPAGLAPGWPFPPPILTDTCSCPVASSYPAGREGPPHCGSDFRDDS